MKYFLFLFTLLKRQTLDRNFGSNEVVEQRIEIISERNSIEDLDGTSNSSFGSDLTSIIPTSSLIHELSKRAEEDDALALQLEQTMARRRRRKENLRAPQRPRPDDNEPMWALVGLVSGLFAKRFLNKFVEWYTGSKVPQLLFIPQEWILPYFLKQN
eukprot:TRINITY_DN11821_c0_g1_i2.p1 TRINITY_DN11821_c0_g1~~TRINITY_DN11821_c0_g1_i2.p1  ORF type:complete len:157 (+),score=66.06 TRINITY_DN11821_c0_g1_i2:65-535(+)